MNLQETRSQDRQLQRELRFICIMGGQKPAKAPQQSGVAQLASMGLIDENGWVTPKGRDFLHSEL